MATIVNCLRALEIPWMVPNLDTADYILLSSFCTVDGEKFKDAEVEKGDKKESPLIIR